MNNSTAHCPAVVTYETAFAGRNDPTFDHIGCFGAYQTGPAGDNITTILRACCNDTVIVVNNEWLYNQDNPSYVTAGITATSPRIGSTPKQATGSTEPRSASGLMGKTKNTQPTSRANTVSSVSRRGRRAVQGGWG